MKLKTYLVDLFFRVCQQIGEVCEHVTVEDNLCLLISPCHNVTHRPQSCCLPFADQATTKKVGVILKYNGGIQF